MIKVPKEIAVKAEEYEKLKNRADALFEELEEWVNENGFEDLYVNGFGVSKEPEGEKQSGNEYCNQYLLGEDYGYGTCYYPIKNSSKYMLVKYSF